MAFKGKWQEIKPWVAGACVALTSNWAGSEIKSLVYAWLRPRPDEEVSLVALAVAILFFLLTVWWLYSMRRTLFHPRTRLLRNETPPPREHLIVFLSHLTGAADSFQEGVPAGLSFSGRLDDDLAALVAHKKTSAPWRWEMPLRAIRHHLGMLRTITVLASRESIHQVHWFGQLLTRTYASSLKGVAVKVFVKEETGFQWLDCPATEPKGGGWDFEQFDDLSQGMLNLLLVLKRQGVRDDQIMIDFTGGQKVTSVVAASVTFNRLIKAQYVQTNPPFAVLGYDILLTSSETGGLGW